MAVGRALPAFMDAVVPMACLPVAMSGRNWMLRRLLTQSIRNDPEWNGGNYTAQPRNMPPHLTYFGLATSGGNEALYKQAPSAAQADALSKAARRAVPGDANDVLYQWESSADYDASPGLDAHRGVRCSRSTRRTTNATRPNSA